jgi:hypothetical protein
VSWGTMERIVLVRLLGNWVTEKPGEKGSGKTGDPGFTEKGLKEIFEYSTYDK